MFYIHLEDEDLSGKQKSISSLLFIILWVPSALWSPSNSLFS